MENRNKTARKKLFKLMASMHKRNSFKVKPIKDDGEFRDPVECVVQP